MSRPLTRCALFVLGAIAAGLTAIIFSLAHVPAYRLVSGLTLVAAAEWLVTRRRFFGVGVEEAFEAAGLLLIAFQWADNSSGSHASLLIALALGVAGLRLLSPFLCTLSAVALSCAIGFIAATQPTTHELSATMAAMLCFAAAFIALLVNRLEFLRPSYSQILNWLIVTMPLSGCLWLESVYPALPQRGGVFVRLAPFLLPLIFGAAALLAGIRRHVHAPLIAFMVCAGYLANELRNLTNLPVEAKLILCGSVALLLTVALDRYLRMPRNGITSNKLTESSGTLDLVHLAGAAALTPAPAPTPIQDAGAGAAFEGGGGTSGGGGASGSY